MTDLTRKLQFALQTDGDWPPVSSEAVWCKSVGTAFQLKNAPFFIKGVAVGDIFKAEPDPVNNHIFEFEVTQSSGHSLIWLLNSIQEDAGPVLSRLGRLGCSIESLQRFSIHAIDVPPHVPEAELSALLDLADNTGFDLAFPVWRRQ
ncbi:MULTISPECIES: DUF4265 domain-containing protein [Xanthomonas]|uniref:DUF4265 domain-containing protein n=1 Tax=Xanthomonas TaxID=338 RepID=UPI000F8F1F15|nr:MULTISPECIES: DUF4265 domain-containing protein [Xanthomonas]MBB3777723.1 hypothetical protein [Xanthomonas euroxanthea]